MNFLQPQCSDEDCCGNGIDGSSCTPFVWINACSIGWYLTDRCERDFLFRIKKDGTVIIGPSNARSYAMTPPDDEVADYSIEYCEGVAEPCTWVQIGSTFEVDTTVEDACPMGIQGQAYIIGIPVGETAPVPTTTFLYCQSSIIVRAAAIADTGQTITHLWIDDTLFTNTYGAISDDVLITADSQCTSGVTFGSSGLGFNDTTTAQVRLPLPIPFAKGSFSVRARQTNGMIIGCVVDIPHCSVHYNAASVTLPSWDGFDISCSADGGMPFGFMSTPSPVKIWCKHYESTLTMTADLGGTYAWITCQTSSSGLLVVGTYSLTYNFQCNGDIRWIDPADTPTVVYSGTYSFNHTVTCNVKAVLEVVEAVPGQLELRGLGLLIDGDVTSTISGSNSWPTALQAAAGSPNYLTELSGVFEMGSTLKNYFSDTDFFSVSSHTPLECLTPYDGDTFQWDWIGPQFPASYWGIIAEDYSDTFTIAPSPLASSSYVSSAVWPADTSFVCDLPEGSYTDEDEAGTTAQFQV